MRSRQRRHEDETPTNGPSPGSSGAGNLDNLMRTGKDYLAAADAAIDHALSGNSEKFNEATRQGDGE